MFFADFLFIKRRFTKTTLKMVLEIREILIPLTTVLADMWLKTFVD